MKEIFQGYLLVSDMDGTLLNSNKEISKENIEAIEYFINNGGKFTIATGRMTASVAEFVSKINMNLPAILHNGAKIYDFYNNQTIADYFIEEHRKEGIRRIGEDKPHIGIEIFVDEVVYVYKACKYTKRYDKHDFPVVYSMPDEVWNKKWNKVLLIGDEDQLDELEAEYKEKYDKGNAVRSGENFFDVIANGVCKGTAVNDMARIHDIDRAKIIAVGDNMNDFEMLQNAQYGFCISSGAKKIIEKASLLAPSNDENPIAYIINYLEKEIIK